MIRFVLSRLIQLPAVICVITFIVFLLIHATPGDPARLLAGQEVTQELLASLRTELGLDKPLLLQYTTFLGKLLHGDLGKSWRTKRPVITEIASALPATVQLAISAMCISLVLGVSTGVICAVKQHSWLDNFVRIMLLIGVSMPVFWVGLLLIYLFSVCLKWFPSSGYGGIKHLILPSLALSTYSTALIARTTRSAMLDALSEDYINTARAKGLHEVIVDYKHALRNALIPIVTVTGINTGILLGGAILCETVFAWPGMGRLLVQGIFTRDVPIIQACVLISSSIFILVNLSVDVLITYIDPRIRYA